MIGDRDKGFEKRWCNGWGVRLWAGLLCLVMASLLVVGLGLMPGAAPAWAASCRRVNDHEICIVRIKRSAKQYWQYKARVAVDGVRRPMEVYDCRDRLRLPKDGTIVPYWQDDAVDVVCALFRKRELMRQPLPKALGN